MRKFLGFALFSAVLTACTPQPAVAPVEQIQKLPNALSLTAATPVSVQNKTVAYQCKKGKTVRVTHTSGDKKSITVEFNQTSHKLSSSVPKQNKKYSNIRWIWAEDFNGKSSLRDKSGKLLAENCVKK